MADAKEISPLAETDADDFDDCFAADFGEASVLGGADSNETSPLAETDEEAANDALFEDALGAEDPLGTVDLCLDDAL